MKNGIDWYSGLIIYFVLVVVVSLFFYLFRLLLVKQIAAVILEHNHCPHCGHALHGLTTERNSNATRCPGCRHAWITQRTRRALRAQHGPSSDGKAPESFWKSAARVASALKEAFLTDVKR